VCRANENRTLEVATENSKEAIETIINDVSIEFMFSKDKKVQEKTTKRQKR
jgi:predicted RNase H-like HicB family nuclease